MEGFKHVVTLNCSGPTPAELLLNSCITRQTPSQLFLYSYKTHRKVLNTGQIGHTSPTTSLHSRITHMSVWPGHYRVCYYLFLKVACGAGYEQISCCGNYHASEAKTGTLGTTLYADHNGTSHVMTSEMIWHISHQSPRQVTNGVFPWHHDLIMINN